MRQLTRLRPAAVIARQAGLLLRLQNHFRVGHHRHIRNTKQFETSRARGFREALGRATVFTMSDAGARTILIVDDSETCRDIATFILSRRGFRVVSVESVRGLSGVIERERPRLVLLDVTMPDVRGDQVAGVANRHQLYACPMVLYSDRPPAELEKLAAASGAAGFIPKAADPDTLVRLIEGFLAA